MKKVLRWVPTVNIILFVLMFIGMTQADCVKDGMYSYCDSELWTADAESFSVADILAMFGHGNGMHLLANTCALLVFAIPAELILGRKKFIAGVAFAMLVHVISSEIQHSNGLGASGWLMAMPGLMFGASMWKIWHEGEEIWTMVGPVIFFAAGIGTVAMDIAMMGDASNTDHLAHIIGFVSGLVFVIAGLPYLAMTIRYTFRTWKRKRAWEKNRRQAWAV
jgi:membrane associated rhomboid family serine protease